MNTPLSRSEMEHESHSGFRDAFAKIHGRPPGACREASCIWTALTESPLGPIIVGATADGVCLVEFSDRRMLEAEFATLRRHFQSAIVPGSHPYLDQVRKELADYFAGRLTAFQVPVVCPGSPFQRRVWDRLRQIPYGATCSYQDLARELGAPQAARAVGTANGQNRISLIIPCYRVVNKDGRLGGYGGGLWRKEWLLHFEREVVNRQSMRSEPEDAVSIGHLPIEWHGSVPAGPTASTPTTSRPRAKPPRTPRPRAIDHATGHS